MAGSLEQSLGSSVRILHVINSLSGSGGAEHGMVREITGFESGIEQHVVRLYAPDQLVPQVVSVGISVIAHSISIHLTPDGTGLWAP